MAIQYPGSPRIPNPVNPLEYGLAGLMDGWEQGRKGLKDRQGADAAYDIYQNAPGRQPFNMPSLYSLGGGTAMAGGAVPAPGTTTGGSTPSVALTGDSSKIYGDFIGTVKAGGLTNPYGLAAVAATGRAESGYSPGNVHRIWSDPSESGQAGNAGGILSWRAERLSKMQQFAAANGDDPQRPSAATQAKFFLSEDPGLVARLNQAGSVEEAQQLMNNAWRFAGYDRPGGEAARRTAMARSYYSGEFGRGGAGAAIEAQAPTQVASLEPSAGIPAGQGSALAYSPSGPSPEAGRRVPTPTPRPEDQTYTTASPTAPGNVAPTAAPVPTLDVPSIVSAVTSGQVSGPNVTREQFRALMASEQTRDIGMALFQSKVTGDPRAAERAVELGLRLETLNFERQRLAQQDALAADDRAYGRNRDAAQDARLNRQVDLQERALTAKGVGYRTLTQDEAAQRGLPPGNYQVGPDGKVDTIGKQGQNITVNTGEGANGALIKKGNEALGADLAEVVKGGRSARRSLVQIDQLSGLLETTGGGFGTIAKQWLGKAGIATEGLDEIQAADALINRLIPAQRPPGSGTMSDADIVMFRQSIPSLLNQPGGNKLIIDTIRSIMTYDAQMGDIASRVLRGELSQQDGDNMMATLENPLAGFDAQPASPSRGLVPGSDSTPRDESGVPVGGAAPAAGSPPVGATATNPQTGRKIRWTGSTWEDVR